MDIENDFHALQKSALKCKSFQQYYATLNIPIESEKQVYDALVQAVKNSRQKGYHGDCEDVETKSAKAGKSTMSGKEGPELELDGQQSQTRILDLFEQFADFELGVKNGDPDQIDSTTVRKSITQGSLKLKDAFNGQDPEAEWKKLCINNFDFVQQEFESNKFDDVTPAGLAAKSDFNELHFTKLNTDKKFLTRLEDKLGC